MASSMRWGQWIRHDGDRGQNGVNPVPLRSEAGGGTSDAPASVGGGAPVHNVRSNQGSDLGGRKDWMSKGLLAPEHPSLRRKWQEGCLRCSLLLLLVLAGCNHTPPASTDTGTATTTTGHDPNDFTSLRKFPLKDLMQSEVKVNGKEIPVWVMDTEAKRAEGYMFLRPEDAPDGHGMIFMFPAAETNFKLHGFFMQNCLLELDIAFISPGKKVLNIQRGKKLDATNLPASAPYKYVLELKAGEAERFGVKPGVSIDIPSHLETKS